MSIGICLSHEILYISEGLAKVSANVAVAFVIIALLGGLIDNEVTITDVLALMFL